MKMCNYDIISDHIVDLDTVDCGFFLSLLSNYVITRRHKI